MAQAELTYIISMLSIVLRGKWWHPQIKDAETGHKEVKRLGKPQGQGVAE